MEKQKQTKQIKAAIPFVEIDEVEEEKAIPSGKVDTAHRIRPVNKFYLYWMKSRIFILLSVGMEALSIILRTRLSWSFVGVLEVVSLVVFVFSALWLTIASLSIKRIKRSFLLPVFFALVSGVLVSIINLFLFFEFWTLYNLFFEPVFYIVLSLLVSLVINLFYFLGLAIERISGYYKIKAKDNLDI